MQCSNDAQCTSGTNGRCVMSGGGVVDCSCTYDTCTHDTDCGAGRTCACHGSPYTFGQGNTCMPGNCRVDSDCGPGGYCSPAWDPNSCGSLGGYYCHTAADQCIDDTDCAASPNGPAVCTYSTSTKRWECTISPACG
jgi:hypothetical protein